MPLDRTKRANRYRLCFAAAQIADVRVSSELIVSRRFPPLPHFIRGPFIAHSALAGLRIGLLVSDDKAPRVQPSRATTPVARANISVESASLRDLPPETLDSLKELARMIGRQLARETRS